MRRVAMGRSWGFVGSSMRLGFSSGLLLLLLLVVGYGASSAVAQRCTALTRSELGGKDNLCSFMPHYLLRENYTRSSSSDSPPALFYVSADLTRKELVFQSRLRSEGLKLLPRKCRQAARALACSGSLLPCNYVPIDQVPWPAVVPIPRPPCYETCVQMVEECGEILAANGSPVPDCNATTNGMPNFPKKELVIDLNGKEVRLPCVDITADDVPDDEFSCPEPMGYDKTNRESPCQIPCPRPVYDDFQVTFFSYWIGPIGIISTIGSGFVALTYAINPRFRKMPGALVFWVAFYVFLYDIYNIYPIAGPDAICNGPFETGDRTNSNCLSQSFLVVIGGAGGALWYLALAVNLWLMLQFDYIADWKVKAPTLILCNCYGLIVWIAATATDNITGPVFNCYLSEEETHAYVRSISYMLMACGAIALLLLFPLIYLIGKAKVMVGNSKSRLRRWLGTVRVFIYVLYYLIVIGLTAGNRIYTEVKRDDVAEGIEKWLICSLSLGDNCVRHRYQLSYVLVIFNITISTLTGVVIFLCFGTSEEVIKYWKAVWESGFKSASSTDAPSTWNTTGRTKPKANTNSSSMGDSRLTSSNGRTGSTRSTSSSMG